jgi:hypothetical protein
MPSFEGTIYGVVRVGLRVADLRHEYASRLVERGVPPAQVLSIGASPVTSLEQHPADGLVERSIRE